MFKNGTRGREREVSLPFFALSFLEGFLLALSLGAAAMQASACPSSEGFLGKLCRLGAAAVQACELLPCGRHPQALPVPLTLWKTCLIATPLTEH